MKGFLAWELGWRAFVAPKIRATSGFLLSSSLAMALGLVPLVVVLSIADGMIESISARTIETALYHAQAWSLAGDDADWMKTGVQLRSQLAAVPGIRGVFPEQQGFALAYAQGGRLGLQVRGIDPQWPTNDSGVRRYLHAVEGSLVLAHDNEVWIGREAAQKLGVKPGDELKLLTTKSKGGLTIPRVTVVRIVAVVSVGYQELDRIWLFGTLALSSSLFEVSQQPIFWGIKADVPLEATGALVAGIKKALGSRWQVVSWQTTGRSQFLNYQATRTLLAIVMFLVLLVAAVNVSTAMISTVRERRRETAILKALGASDQLIRGQFLVLGFGSGVLGTALGLGLGMGVALAINPLVSTIDALVNLFSSGGGYHLLNTAFYLETIPVKFDPLVLSLAGFGSITLAILASWLPSRKAARERPLEVLRRA